MNFPNIARACLEIALDNGGINRSRPLSAASKETAHFLTSRPYYDHLPAIDRWLGQLTEDDFSTICTGEYSEMESVLAGAPPFTDDLLNEYFDEVC